MQVKLLTIKEPENFERYAKYVRLVSPERQKKIALLRRPEDKTVSLLSRLFIKKELAEASGMEIGGITVLQDAYGKPYAKELPDYFFSVSHTENVIALVTAQNSVGIDIERLLEPKMRVAKRFFLPDEYKSVVESENRAKEFFRIWTLKEAYVKMKGMGFRIPPTSFSVLDSSVAAVSQSVVYENYIISVCGIDRGNISIENIKIP